MVYAQENFWKELYFYKKTSIEEMAINKQDHF
jgi:hypothetical protein